MNLSVSHLRQYFCFFIPQQSLGSNINLLYSTPSCYLHQLHSDNRTWTDKKDDFFPYADRPHGFWTGYFTSRPTAKRYFRVVNSFYQVCSRAVRFGSKVGQIGPKCDESRSYSDQISVHFGFVSQNVLKYDMIV